jgi:hypothetical protein
VIFAILPGPNLIGYWFAYRAIHHALVFWGIGRARRNTIPTELHPVMALDVPIEDDESGKARHAALNGAGLNLDLHVRRCRGSSLTKADAGSPSSRVTPTVQDPPKNGPGNS